MASYTSNAKYERERARRLNEARAQRGSSERSEVASDKLAEARDREAQNRLNGWGGGHYW